MNLNITGYSTALFATWYFIEELGILFDAGDGLTAHLLQKSRKIKHIFISHADRDHLTGLLQFNQLNAEGNPTVYYPKDCRSFPFLESFFKKFDPQSIGTTWIPIAENASIPIKDDIFVESIKNGHVASADGICKSLSYKVMQTKRKLKPEFAELSGLEIKELTEKQGKENITVEVKTNILSYSGDTPVEDFERFAYSKILIHEATFLSKEEAISRPHKNLHSSLDVVMEMVSNIHIEALIVGHFSSRYSDEEIDKRILDLCEKYAINIPVYRILSGEVAKNILSTKPVNS